MRSTLAAVAFAFALDVSGQVTVALTATPQSPVPKGQPITLTATVQFGTLRTRPDVAYTFTAQRISPCPQSYVVLTNSAQSSATWTPPETGQYSFAVSARYGTLRSAVAGASVTATVAQFLPMNPPSVVAVEPNQNPFRVTATLADPGYAGMYMFTFRHLRPASELQGNFTELALTYSSWVNVASTTVNASVATASWDVTLDPKNHEFKVEVLRQSTNGCDPATGTASARYVVPLPSP